VKQTIDIYSGKSSVGGFSINLSDYDQGGGNYFSDNFASEYFYNREVKLYLHTDGITALADCPLLYLGLFDKYSIDKNQINIDISNNNKEISKPLLTTIITKDDYPNAPDESIGKYLPVIYGDHYYYIGNETLSKITIDARNAMVDVIKINKYVGYISSHQLKEIESIWGYDSVLGRYVRLTGFTTIQNNSSGAIVEFGETIISESDGVNSYLNDDSFTDATNSPFGSAQVGDVLVIEDSGDYYYHDIRYITSNSNIRVTQKITISGSGITYRVIRANEYYDILQPTSSTGIVDGGSYESFWTNPGDAGDNDLTTSATFDTEYTSFSTIKLNINFKNWEYDTADNINEVEVFAITQVSDNSDASVELNGTDIQSGDIKVLTDCGSVTASLAGISDPVDLVIQDVAGTDPAIRGSIFHVWKRIKYSNIGINKFKASCYGYDIAGETYDANPGKVIKHIIDTYTDVDTNSTAFTNTSTRTGNSYLLSINITKPININVLCEEIAQESKTYIIINSNNEAYTFTFTSSYTTTRAKIKLEDVIYIKTHITDINNAINSLSLKYYSNNSELIRANSTADTNIGMTIIKNITADYISDDTTAGLLADHYCKDASTAFWGMPRNLIEFETADMRGADAGWDGADFEPIYALELFDIIELDHIEWDSVKKCNGESWDGKQFLIYEITRGLTTIKVKGLEL